MVVTIKKNRLRTRGHETLDAAIRGYNKSITNIIRKHKGRIVREKSNTYLMSFDSVTNAIKSALKIAEIYNCVITPDLQFKIGICAGVPVTQKDSVFEDTIARAHYLSYITDEKITISKEVKDLYESENRHKSVVENSFNSLQEEDLNFIIQLMEYTESAWSHSDISVSDFHENLGYSKSKLYRTMMSLIGKSPKSFLKEYRLQKALELLEINSALHISEIAYKTGFSSPNYFSKCFKEVYGILPSKYK